MFRGTTPTDFEPLARHVAERSYPRGAHIWHAGDQAISAWLILAGEVTAYRTGPDGEEFVVAVQLAGDVIGQLPMWDAQPRRLVDSVATASTRCLVFPLEQLKHLVETRPRVAASMIATYSRWLRYRDALDSETAYQNLAGQIACKLLELRTRTDTAPGAPIPIDLPQARLAAMLGASRENVNRALARLVKSGEVLRLGRRLAIPDPGELARRYSWASVSDPVVEPR